MSVALALFDDVDDEPALRPLAPQRTDLGSGAWLDHQGSWLAGADALFQHVAQHAAWQAERRHMYDRVVDVPRLVAWYSQGEPLPHPILELARHVLSAWYRPEVGEDLVTAGFCYYRNGSDSVAWHGDTIGRSRTEDTVVAIVSLGTARPFLLRPRGGRLAHRFALGHGDLLVMGGSAQRTWEHAVPKSSTSPGARVSVQFRTAGVR